MTAAPRKLATIVALDIAGYSARTEADEATTTAEVGALRHVIEGIANAHGGRVFNTAGDGFMLEFASSLAAVEAAHDLAAKCEPKVRVGVHLGDVVVQPNGDLLGHGVNVAARLMARSDPGAALISADVRRTIRGPLAERLVSRGLLQLDKMAETIEAFALPAAASAIVAALPKSNEPLLAVLAFDNLSNDPDMQFFSDGISEEVLHTISRAKDLRVIGKASSFQFRGAAKAVRKVASELNATHILDGSVRRSGQRVRVSAQLVEVATQTTLWSDRYDRELADVFEMQDELANAIAGALNTTLINRSRVQSIDPMALDNYMRARSELSSDWIDADYLSATRHLEAAVARAPDFAKAWGLLAMTRALSLPSDRDSTGTSEHTAAQEAAARALRLDANCAEAFCAQCLLEPAFSGYARKLHNSEKARSLAPADSLIVSLCMFFVASVGQVAKAIKGYENLIRIEPDVPRPRSALAYFLLAAHKDSDALSISSAALAAAPDVHTVWLLHYAILFLLGRHEESNRLIETELSRSGSNLNSTARAVSFLKQVASESPDKRLESFRQAVFLGPHRSLVLNNVLIAAQLGLADFAFDCFEEAFCTHRPIGDQTFGETRVIRATQTYLLFLRHGEALRRDPRFAGVCAQLGLAEYWQESGEWPDCADEVPYDFRVECGKAVRELAKA